MRVIKKNALMLITGLALVTALTTHAQESGHLSAKYLKQASPLAHWPKGFEPRNVDFFVHNEGWINASPNIVWGNLIDALQWPGWYSNSADVHIEDGKSKLAMGVSFTWKTFGFPVRSTVDIVEQYREIGWSVNTPEFSLHHTWVLVPERGGTRVINEEAQKGPAAIKFRLDQPNAMYDGHDWWMSALKARSELMAKH